MANIGSTLNKRYLLKKHIAGGGFAQVFLASDLLLGRQVAVKVLDQSMARDADILKRFRQEAKAVATLEHPNILPVYDYGEANGAPYLVLPYEGNTSQVLLAHMQLVPATLAGTPNMRSIHPAVVQELDQVILKVLAKLPNDRYQTCQALCSGYYKALKADPAKSAGKYRRDDNANILDLGGTIIDKNLVIPSTPLHNQAMEGVSVGKSPVPPAPDLNATESTLRDIPPNPPDLNETIVAPHRPPAKKD